MTGPRPTDDLEKRLRALRPLGPSAELRERVLNQAAANLALPVTWRQRLWASWAFRWGWAVGFAAIALVGAWSQRAFEETRWGSANEAAHRTTAEAAVTRDRRNAAVRAALRVEGEPLLADDPALTGGNPNRWDRERAVREAISALSEPPREPDGRQGSHAPSASNDRRST